MPDESTADDSSSSALDDRLYVLFVRLQVAREILDTCWATVVRSVVFNGVVYQDVLYHFFPSSLMAKVFVLVRRLTVEGEARNTYSNALFLFFRAFVEGVYALRQRGSS